MENKTIPQLISILSNLAVMVSVHTDADIFFSYRAHIQRIDVEIHNIGWETIREPNSVMRVDISDSDYKKVIKSLINTIEEVQNVASNYNFFKKGS